VATIASMILNFPEFLMGSPATVKNIIVTLIYLISWIVFLIILLRSKTHGLIKYNLLFWLITFSLALLTYYANATEATLNWAIPFVIIFLGPWYGIRILTGNFLILSVFIMLISSVMAAINAVLLMRKK
jgi:hypothetical protein